MNDTFGVQVGSNKDEQREVSAELLMTIAKLSTEGYTVVSTESMRGGAFNLIVKAVIKVHKSNESDETKTVVFRFPKDWSYQSPEAGFSIRDQTGIHTFLREKNLSFHVPEILEYRIDSNTIFDRPYMVMEYVPSVCLIEVYKFLPVEYKMQVAQQFVEILAALQSIRFEKAGQLTAERYYHDHHRPYGCVLIGTGVEVKGFELSEGDIICTTRPAKGLEDLVSSKLEGYIELEKEYMAENGRKDDTSAMQRLKQLQTVAKRMKRYGLFDEEEGQPQPNILCHWDLLPRNLLVRLHPDFSSPYLTLPPDAYFGPSNEAPGTLIKIVSVIDWDNTTALPASLTHVPPTWLWDIAPPVSSEMSLTPNGSFGPFWDGRDPDLYPEGYYDQSNGVLSEENQKMKEYFDKLIEGKIPGYLSDAYGTKGRQQRRLWRFLRNGVHGQGDCQRYFIREWNKFEKSLFPYSKAKTGLNGVQTVNGVAEGTSTDETKTNLERVTELLENTLINDNDNAPVAGPGDITTTTDDTAIIDWAALMETETTSNNAIVPNDEPTLPTPLTIPEQKPMNKKALKIVVPAYRSLIVPEHKPINPDTILPEASLSNGDHTDQHTTNPSPSETKHKRTISYPAEQLSNLLDQSLDPHSTRISLDFNGYTGSISDSSNRQFRPSNGTLSEVDGSSVSNKRPVPVRQRTPIDTYLGSNIKSTASTKTSRLSTMGSMITLFNGKKENETAADTNGDGKGIMKENYATRIKRFLSGGDKH